MKRVLKTLGLTKTVEAGPPAERLNRAPAPASAPENSQPTPAPAPSTSSGQAPEAESTRPGPCSMQSPVACPEPVERARPEPAEWADAEPHAFPLSTSAPFDGLRASPGATVLSLDSSNKILSANEACGPMFGWEAEALIGQPLEVLLHQGLDQHVAKWLQQRQSEDQTQGTSSLRVVARRKDGTEFPASVTPLTWNSDTTLTRRSEAAPGWTAVLRSLAVAAPPPTQSPGKQDEPPLTAQLLELQRETDELNARLAVEHEAAGASRQRAEALQDRMAENAASFERTTSELAKQAAEQERTQSELRVQLETTEGLSKQLEAARDELTQRNHSFEATLLNLRQQQDELTRQRMEGQEAAVQSRQRIQALDDRLRDNKAEQDRVNAQLENSKRDERSEMELATLQRVSDALKAKLTSEQWTATGTKRRHDELEKQLRAVFEESERIKTDRDKLAVSHARMEAELQARVQAAKLASEQLDGALKAATARCNQVETDLASIQQARQEMSQSLLTEQQAEAASKQRSNQLQNRLRERAAELTRVKAERDYQTQTRAQLEAELQPKLAALQQERDALDQKLATAQQETVASKQHNTQLEEQLRQAIHRAEQVQAELNQRLADQTAETDKAKTALKTVENRLEQELGNLRQERHETYQKFGAEKQASQKLKRQIKDLEKQLSDTVAGLAAAKVELQKAAATHGRTDAALRAELAAAAQKGEAARQEQARLQSELDSLRQTHTDLCAQHKEQQQSTQTFTQRVADLENQLRERASELDRTKASLESQSAERARLESAAGHAGNSEELTTELNRLREVEAAQGAELAELDQRLRQGVAALARATADLEKERGERRRVEQRSTTLTAQLQELHGNLQHHLESDRATAERIGQLEERLREQEDAATHATTDLQKEVAAREIAEQQLRATGPLIAQLRNCVSSFEQAKDGFKRMQDELESRLQASMKALSESQTRLQQETAERRRVEENSAAVHRNLEEQAQSNAIALAKVQAELQAHLFERQRLESEAIHSRYASVDSTRVGNNMVNSFRRRIRPPTDLLIQSSRRLLELGLEPEQKQLAESVLENALLLRSSLQEGSSARPGDTEGAAPELQTDSDVQP